MNNNFLEIQFPTDISYGSSGGPEYYTNIITTINGNEFRNSRMLYPKMKFNVVNGIKNKQQAEQVINFFRNCKGKSFGFRYKDWSDFQAKNEIIKIIDSNTLQLIKTYALTNDVYEERIITKPIENTIKLYINNQLIPNNQFIVNIKNGIIKLNKAIQLNDEIKANFEFDIPVRFDVDHLAISIESQNFYSLNDIPLIEITSF